MPQAWSGCKWRTGSERMTHLQLQCHGTKTCESDGCILYKVVTNKVLRFPDIHFKKELDRYKAFPVVI